MIADLPVARSNSTRFLFLGSAALTVATMLWAHELMMHGEIRGFSRIFYLLFTRFDYPAASGLLLALAAAVFVPDCIWVRRVVLWLGDNPAATAACVAVILSVGTLVVYRNHPLAMDEYAVLFQSKIFAAGHLAGRFPPQLLDWLVPKHFQDVFLDISRRNGSVMSAYWPSFSLLLTPFTWLGISWACNPVISALTVLAIHRLALTIFEDRAAAGLAVLLTLASPVFFADGISYYSMPAHLLGNCVYAVLLARPTRHRAFVAGVVGSITLTLHNPVPHMLFALPWLWWIARREDGPRLFAWLCVGYAPLCLILGVGWFAFSVHLMHEGSSVSATAAGNAGFEHILSAFRLPDATLVLARGVALAKIWLWATPGLLVLAAAGGWAWRRHAICRLLVDSAALTFVGYLFVPFDQGHGWGYRYFHSAWLALPLLATAALTPSGPRGADSPGLASDDTRAFVVACALLTLVLGVGLRGFQINRFIADDLSQLPHYAGRERRIVFIDGKSTFYGEDLVRNDPWLRGAVICMIERGETADTALMHRYYPQFHRVYAGVHGMVWSAARPDQALRFHPPASMPPIR